MHGAPERDAAAAQLVDISHPVHTEVALMRRVPEGDHPAVFGRRAQSWREYRSDARSVSAVPSTDPG
jgi:hypothetical protein